eukprot:6213436-Pleurochrysis_carterae.AAC.1
MSTIAHKSQVGFLVPPTGPADREVGRGGGAARRPWLCWVERAEGTGPATGEGGIAPIPHARGASSKYTMCHVMHPHGVTSRRWEIGSSARWSGPRCPFPLRSEKGLCSRHSSPEA